MTMVTHITADPVEAKEMVKQFKAKGYISTSTHIMLDGEYAFMVQAWKKGEDS